MKEVKRSKNLSLNKVDFYLTLYNSISDGLSPVDICKKFEISKQALNYYLRRLKEAGSITKIGYGTWETRGFKDIKEVKKITLNKYNTHDSLIYETKVKEIRGHAFILTLKIPKLTNWYNREKYLKSKGIAYKNKKGSRIQRIEFRKHKIWLCNKCLVIYSPVGKSYFSSSAIESQESAVYDLLNIIQGLESLLNTSFKIGKEYKFKISRHEFSRINDSLAKQCNKEGKKLSIKLDNGWFYIDNSYQLNEAETAGKDAIPYMDDHYKPFIESLMKTPFKVDEFTELKGEFYTSMKLLTEQITAHLSVIKEIKELTVEQRIMMNAITELITKTYKNK